MLRLFHIIIRFFYLIRIYKLNIFKTVFFNYNAFGIKGYKLPILLFGKIDIQNMHRGCIEFTSVH